MAIRIRRKLTRIREKQLQNILCKKISASVCNFAYSPIFKPCNEGKINQVLLFGESKGDLVRESEECVAREILTILKYYLQPQKQSLRI